MGGLFGKQKKPPSRITEQDKAVLQLKQQRDKLKQYQKRIELSLENDRQLAIKCLSSGRKDRAKMLLRKKKYQEKLLSQTDVQLENLEKLASDLEYAQVEQQILDGLKTGNLALKKVHEILTIDEVERVLDETNEAVEKQREIDAILSGSLSEQDEEDVLAELDAMVDADKEKEMDATNDIVEDDKENDDLSNRLPDVPTEDFPEKEKRRKVAPKQEEKIALET